MPEPRLKNTIRRKSQVEKYKKRADKEIERRRRNQANSGSSNLRKFHDWGSELGSLPNNARLESDMERIWRFLGLEDLWPIEGDFSGNLPPHAHGLETEPAIIAAYSSRQTLSDVTFNAFKP